MSMTSYTPAYSAAQSPNEHDLGVQLGYIIGNKLQFAGEQSKIIYDLSLEQVSACQLPARCIRLFNTILNQTIGYQKREDHATTTRLQELTKIRYDHIGEAIRFLSRANIIQWRQGGKYNNYLSVNYHFSSWFQKDPAKRITTNDPTVLLPERYKKPIDEGFGADFLDDDDNDYPISQPSPTDNQAADIQTEISDATDKNQHSLDKLDKKAIVEIIEEVLEQHHNKQFNTAKAAPLSEPEETLSIEAKTAIDSHSESKSEKSAEPVDIQIVVDTTPEVETKPSTEKSAEPVETQIAIDTTPEVETKPSAESIVNSEEYQQLQQQLAQQTEQFQQEINNLTEAKNNQSDDLLKFKNDQAILEQQLLERLNYEQTQAAILQTNDETIADLEQKNQHLQAQSGNQHLKNSIHQAVSNDQSLAQFDNLDYPPQLSKEERFSVQKLVSKAGSREQDILDLLKIRLANTVDPLKNCLSYFASLINRHRKGALDFSALKSSKPSEPSQTSADIKANRDIHAGLDKLIDVYRECHYKRVYYRKQLEDDYSQYNQDYYTEFNNKAHAVYDEIFTYVETHQLNKNMIAGLKHW